ncbi:MAG TPA: transglutaminase-like domain-containing protein [Polyangiaceae bacterium]|jgi:transglutaminase-like putative cysteine protease|nr:transglutaminase-like domain-containing protein [Polyangiaceae bacterium]
MTRRHAFVVLLLAVVTAGPASADVVLHEYVPPDAVEDLRLGATTSDGVMSAAIQTQSGPVTSPDLDRPSDASNAVYGANRTPAGGGSTFRVDRDTSRPDVVSYDDPFTPSIAPYKREFAYDAVDEHLDLVVHDPGLTRLSIGGTPRPEDDQFYADLEVDLVDGQPVRIPSVGPGARILALRTVPKASVQAFHDSADGWFIEGDHDGRVRLVMHLAIDRAAFGSPFADTEWPRLWRLMPALPDRVKTEGIRVARQIGVVDGTGPAEALRILVRHFRAFAPSNDHPKSTGTDLYRELATSQKGVCRHRSYAFVVTALALGIPSRFVRNEAHAWVEVFDGTRWHRIDLGGAADHLDSPDASRLPHVPPRDPFEWPAGSDSGAGMADRTRAMQGAPRQNAAATTTGAPAMPVPSAGPEPESKPDDTRPRAALTLKLGGAEAKRGGRLELSGRVDAAGAACSAARIDLFLEPKGGPSHDRVPLGVLVTDADGRYEGRIVVPYTVTPGDYDVRASTPGNSTCGDGLSP